MNTQKSIQTAEPAEGFAADEVKGENDSWRIANLRVGLVAGVAVLVTAVAVAGLWAAVRMVEIVVNSPR
jgi:hypothetical protein